MTKQQDIIDGRYVLIRPLGFGGMGEVYLAKDQLLDDALVAIKLLSEQVSRNPKQVQRFKQEVALARQLRHNNIVQVFDTGETSTGRYYITMEYVEGIALREKLEQGPLALYEALEILFYISLGLSAAHEQSVIHRDVKPDNVLISKDGTVKLVDFGVAKSIVDDKGLTETGELVGTSYYMAPEQFTNVAHDERVDIYALGILAFELITGRRPFVADSYVALYTLHLTEQLPAIADFRKGLPGNLQEFVERCAAKSPERRFQKATQLCSYLAGELKASGVELPAVALAGIAKDDRRRGLQETIHVIQEQWKRLGTILRAAILASMIYCLVVVLSTNAVGLLERLNLEIMDNWFFVRGRRAVEPNVLIAKISEKSFKRYSFNVREPWPRSKQAELIEALGKAKARAVVIDFLLSGPGSQEEDLRLARSMQRVPVYIAKAVGDGGYVLPEDVFIESAEEVFSIGVREKRGVVRQFAFSGSIRGVYPSVAKIAFGYDFGKRELPRPSDYINYYGPPGTIQSHAVEELLEMDEARLTEVVGNAIVFVGTAKAVSKGAAEPDAFLTPAPGRLPGVEIHATCVSNLLDRMWIRSIGGNGEAEALVSLVVSWAIFAMRLKAAIIVAFGFAIVTIALQVVLLSMGYYVPLIGGTLASVVGLALHAFFLTRRSRKLEHAIRGV